MVNECARKRQYTETPPCHHNEWDNIRFKNMIVTLRCRVCREQWKTLNVSLKKCAAFYEKKCPKGADCDLVHINRYKHTRELCVNSLTSIEMHESDEDCPITTSPRSEVSDELTVPPPQDYASIWCTNGISPDVVERKWEQFEHGCLACDDAVKAFSPAWVSCAP
eukprot:TRINITY_DN9945_c0_g1_i1.p1 TRINITY_DN9945_c0_g1~~TRINITY_DN9945_c0_g1_i1.p1  ORF type:complete len:165 (+),score=38.11 TRINITY_DN9945_c0_g1_i1:287-781(+)